MHTNFDAAPGCMEWTWPASGWGFKDTRVLEPWGRRRRIKITALEFTGVLAQDDVQGDGRSRQKALRYPAL